MQSSQVAYHKEADIQGVEKPLREHFANHTEEVPKAHYLSGPEKNMACMVAAWRREMRKSLYCLLNREEGTLLADTIEMYFVLVNRRLDFF